MINVTFHGPILSLTQGEDIFKHAVACLDCKPEEDQELFFFIARKHKERMGFALGAWLHFCKLARIEFGGYSADPCLQDRDCDKGDAPEGVILAPDEDGFMKPVDVDSFDF